MKILFFGTAFISKAFLENLHKSNHKIFCVTMPDKPAARGQKITPPEVKVFAKENDIPFIQPEKFTSEIIEQIKSFNADAGIAVAYGRLIPKAVFEIPKYKTFNIHFSLLPKYRGAAPVQYALCAGDKETGVTAFFLEQTLDSGAVIVQEKLKINANDNTETLFAKLIPLGIEVMNKALILLEQGATGTVQKGEVTYAPSLKKEDGKVDWKCSAVEIHNQIRGLSMWPGTFSVIGTGNLEGRRMKFIESEVVETNTVNEDPGKIFKIEKNKGFVVLCGTGKLLFTKIQPENKAVMNAWDFIQSGQLAEGDCFQD